MPTNRDLKAACRAVRSDLGMRFGRALTVGLAAALIALAFADPRLAAEPASRGEGRMAFIFGESGGEHPSQLAVMDADGKNRRALPFDDVHGGLSWSPDGRSIAFGLMSFTPASKGRNGIYTINVDRRKYRRVLRNGVLPDWSPNGRSIAFERGRDIWVFNLNDRRQRRIVRHGSSPSWSPDARKLAFVRGNDLWVLELAGKKERRLVRNGGAASWSPDGRQIAFSSRCPDCFIFVVRSDGTKRRRLFRGANPVWSPNGQEIAFVGADKRRGFYDAIVRARLDGSGRRVLFGQYPYCGCGFLDWAAERGRP